MGHANQEQVSYRTKIVAQELLAGKSNQWIAERYCEEWGIQHITPYLSRAKAKIKRDMSWGTDDDIRTDLLTKYNYLYSKLVEEKKYGQARQVLDSVASMLTKLNINVGISGNIETIEIVKVISGETTEDIGYDEV